MHWRVIVKAPIRMGQMRGPRLAHNFCFRSAPALLNGGLESDTEWPMPTTRIAANDDALPMARDTQVTLSSHDEFPV